MSFPAPPIFHRTLSYEHDADTAASTFFPRCQEGDTIFSNYWLIDNHIIYAYFHKVGDTFMKFQKECLHSQLPTFTFYVSQP